MALPQNLQAIVDLFAGLATVERRELLVHFAAQAETWAPRSEEVYVVEECRHDAACTDAVGIHIRRGDEGALHFRMSLGPQVQTLTRALGVILCRGLDGLQAADLAALEPDFIPKIVGHDLVRLRSQTVYYMLGRMKSAGAAAAALKEKNGRHLRGDANSSTERAVFPEIKQVG